MYVGMQYTYVCHDLIVYLGRRNHSYQLSFFFQLENGVPYIQCRQN